MDFLAAYSSSDEESSPALESHNPKASLSLPIPQTPSSLASLVLYLENYSMNRKKLLSGFILLQWLPEAQVALSLQKCCENVVENIQSKMPHVKPRYTWHYTGANKPLVFGRYGYTNVRAVNSLHVSLFPNFLADPHRFTQLHANLLRSVKGCPPPEELIKEKKASVLDKMLLEKGQKKYVSLKVNPNLRCYMSSKSATIFVALDINEVVKPGEQFLPEYLYLRSLSKMIEDQAKIFECKYDWKTTTQSADKLEDGLPLIRYHVTVLLGEVHFFKHKMNSKHFRQLKNIVQTTDMTEYLDDISVDVETMRLRNVAGLSFDIKLVNS